MMLKFKIMKKVILFCLVVILLNSTKLLAQNGGKMQEAFKEYLKDSVKLSDPLTDSVMSIRMQFMPQMRNIFMDQSASMQDKQTKMQTLRTEAEARYKAAGLSDEQVQAIHSHEDAMMAKMQKRMSDNSNGGGNQ